MVQHSVEKMSNLSNRGCLISCWWSMTFSRRINSARDGAGQGFLSFACFIGRADMTCSSWESKTNNFGNLIVFLQISLKIRQKNEVFKFFDPRVHVVAESHRAWQWVAQDCDERLLQDGPQHSGATAQVHFWSCKVATVGGRSWLFLPLSSLRHCHAEPYEAHPEQLWGLSGTNVINLSRNRIRKHLGAFCGCLIMKTTSTF